MADLTPHAMLQAVSPLNADGTSSADRKGYRIIGSDYTTINHQEG